MSITMRLPQNENRFAPVTATIRGANVRQCSHQQPNLVTRTEQPAREAFKVLCDVISLRVGRVDQAILIRLENPVALFDDGIKKPRPPDLVRAVTDVALR